MTSNEVLKAVLIVGGAYLAYKLVKAGQVVSQTAGKLGQAADGVTAATSGISSLAGAIGGVTMAFSGAGKVGAPSTPMSSGGPTLSGVGGAFASGAIEGGTLSSVSDSGWQ